MQLQRAQYQANIKAVLWLTGMSEAELFTLMLDTGVAWLSTQYGPDAYAEVLHEEDIWNWWANEWYRRDDEHSLPALYDAPAKERLARYRAMHQEIFIRWTPPYNWLKKGIKAAIEKAIEGLKKEGL